MRKNTANIANNQTKNILANDENTLANKESELEDGYQTLPTTIPAYICDVIGDNGHTFMYMALNDHGAWVGVSHEEGKVFYLTPDEIDVYTNDEGDVLTRDGNTPNGYARFRELTEDDVL